MKRPHEPMLVTLLKDYEIHYKTHNEVMTLWQHNENSVKTFFKL